VNRPCVAVAWSGGRDSTALLHATLCAAGPLGICVVALHVHHGLNVKADDWLVHCERQAARWSRCGHAIVFRASRLAGQPSRGESVEAWARKARYAALRRMAVEEGADLVLLAHHRRDQAETMVLQALRGAGVAGLSGMPRQVARDGLSWARPWLNSRSEAIAAYVRRHRLRHIEDDSNVDPRFARNRLRHQVWPALSAAFPAAEVALAEVATWAQQATGCLAALAALDLADRADASGLKISGLAELGDGRRSNALRHWLQAQLGQPAPATLVRRLDVELAGPSGRSWPVAGGELRVHRGRLRFTTVATDDGGEAKMARERALRISRAGRYRLPGWGGHLVVERVCEGGTPFAWLARLELRERTGGEQFQAGIGRPPRSLKKQYQALGVSAWDRKGPLAYSGGQLVFVPGLGLDARVIGLQGQPQARLRWIADDLPIVR
jgi:tRNA(Ile)-lysidine synthase